MNVNTLISSIQKIFTGEIGPKVIVLKQGADLVTNILGLGLGLIVYFIIIGIPVITAFDLLVISVPGLRGRFYPGENVEEHKKRFISKDACEAIRVHLESGGEVQALGYYGRKRIKTAILVSCMLILVSCGAWNVVVSWCLTLSSAIVEWIMSW